MNNADITYLNLINKVLTEGEEGDNRTDTPAISLFGLHASYDLREGFPLLTTKRVHFKSVVGELLWFLSGSTSAKELEERYGVTIWNEWANENGNLGDIYGAQMRGHFYYNRNGMFYHDQMLNAINLIKNSPTSRRIIVNCWNVSDLGNMALAPCHAMFQFNVSKDGYLDLQLYQRSADMFLGVPFNIASYALLLTMVAQVTGKKPRYFHHALGNAHIYTNHVEQVKEQLSRVPRPLPRLVLDGGVCHIDNFTVDSIKLEEYNPHPAIKGEVAV